MGKLIVYSDKLCNGLCRAKCYHHFTILSCTTCFPNVNNIACAIIIIVTLFYDVELQPLTDPYYQGI